MGTDERDPEYLKREGYLERVEDFELGGRLYPASRLGWRITPLFAAHFLGRIFDTPTAVFSEDMLRPELQSLDDFAEGVANIAEAQAKAARDYIEDGSADEAIPPLRAILHVMAEGSYEGKSVHDPEIRRLFDRDYVLGSDWYQERLERYRDREIDYVERSTEYLRSFLAERAESGSMSGRRAQAELGRAQERLAALRTPSYIERIRGSIGLDALFKGRKSGTSSERRDIRAL